MTSNTQSLQKPTRDEKNYIESNQLQKPSFLYATTSSIVSIPIIVLARLEMISPIDTLWPVKDHPLLMRFSIVAIVNVLEVINVLIGFTTKIDVLLKCLSLAPGTD
jgi:hypothetical protein